MPKMKVVSSVHICISSFTGYQPETINIEKSVGAKI